MQTLNYRIKNKIWVAIYKGKEQVLFIVNNDLEWFLSRQERKQPVHNFIFYIFILKVHKREKFFVSDFEFFTILQLVKLKY